jgi:hypothetical protein
MKRRFFALFGAAAILPEQFVRATKLLALNHHGDTGAPHKGNSRPDISDFLAKANGADAALTLSERAAQFISVKDFGAKGDGVTDDRDAIQAAVDWVIYQNSTSQPSLGGVLIPAGIYKVSDTIHLGYGTGFTGVLIQGEGMKYGGEPGMGGSALVATFKDRPLINFQGARNSAIRNLALVGLNREYVAKHQLGSLSGPLGNIDDTQDSAWIDPALPASAASQFAPYCGISIDAYSGLRPIVAYPDVKYPTFLGLVSQYGKAFSSNVLIENVAILGFAVGVVNQPSNADGNGDFTKLRRVQISHCQYGVSVCNTQSRLFHVQDSTIVLVHSALVTNKHGRQKGCSEILFEGTELSNLIYWHQMSSTAFALGPRFEFCRGEVVYAIGSLSLGAQTSSSTVYDHCYFGFDARRARGQPVWSLTNNEGMVTFDSCTFLQPVGTGPLHLQGDAAGYRIVNCNQLMGLNARHDYERQALNASCGFTFSRLRTDLADFSPRNASLWDLDAGVLAPAARYGLRNKGARNVLVPFYSKFVRSSAWGDPGVAVMLESASAEDKTKIGGPITVSGLDVTYTSGRTEEILINRGGANGDIVYDDASGIIFYVRSRTGSTITMRAQTGYDAAGNLRTPITKTGNFWYQNCRAYSPSAVVQGDVASMSPTATNVGSDEATFLHDKTLGVGDYAAVWPAVDNWIAMANRGNRVAEVDGRRGVFTFASVSTKNEAKKRFSIFYRLEPVNA